MKRTSTDTHSEEILSEQQKLEREIYLKAAALLKVELDQLDLEQPIYALGLDSLQAIELKNFVEKNYGIKLPVVTFFEEITVTQLAARLSLQILSRREESETVTSNPAGPEKVEVELILPEKAQSLSKDLPQEEYSGKSPQETTPGLEFSLFYFASSQQSNVLEQYRLVLEGAKFADQHGFKAVWLPERHFNAFGGLYPNPVVLAAALAPLTTRLRLRAGSVVLPLHQPVRVAEEWAVVDNLSGGRVDLAFATGWNPNDFVLAPQNYEQRQQLLFEGMKTIQQLWRGEKLQANNGKGQPVALEIYPRPLQPALKTWVTCSGGVERFREAGAIGANILTALLFQSVEELAVKIEEYRAARAEHGFDPEEGHVTLMLHSFVGPELESVKEQVRPAFIQYLKGSVELWRNRSQRLEDLSPEAQSEVLEYAFERYFQTGALIGTPESCHNFTLKLKAAGVNEIACLVDFGLDTGTVLAHLPYLDRLRQNWEQPINPSGEDWLDQLSEDEVDRLLESMLVESEGRGAK